MGTCQHSPPSSLEQYKITLVGDRYTGKTAFFNRVIKQSFLSTSPTKTFNYAERPFPLLNDKGAVLLSLLDLSGREELQEIVSP